MRDRASSSSSLANGLAGNETDNENTSAEPLNLFGDDYYSEVGSSSRKRRRVSLSVDPSDGDRFIASRSSSSVDPRAVYRKSVLDQKMKNAPHDGRLFVYGNATETQQRYQQVLSSIITPNAQSSSSSSFSPPPSARRPVKTARSASLPNIFSYTFPSNSARSNGKAPLLETTDAQKFRLAPWTDQTMASLTSPTRTYREISSSAYKVLDAPEIEDNFYLNLVDWGRNNKIAVGLKNAVYMYDAALGSVVVLDAIAPSESDKLHPASLKWIGDGTTVAWGNKRGDLTVYDAETKAKVRRYEGQLKRIGVIDTVGTLIAAGSGDSTIVIRDTRQVKPVTTITAHSHEVCGLKFSPFDEVVLASGGNDNKLFIWDLRNTSAGASSSKGGIGEPSRRTVHRGRLSTTPLSTITNPPTAAGAPGPTDASGSGGAGDWDWTDTGVDVGAKLDTSPLFHLAEHRAAVRGLAWSPHTRGLLASGGGRQDPIIRFWNTSLGTKIAQLQCHAQVTNLSWSSTTDELLSTHGFPSEVPSSPDGPPAGAPGVVTVWHYPTRNPIISFAAHNCRVSYLAVSPGGESIATAGRDETLRFFNLFPGQASPPSRGGEGVLGRVR